MASPVFGGMNRALLFVLLALTPVPALAHAAHDGNRGGGHPGPDRDRDGRETSTCPAPVVAAFDSLDDTLRHLETDVDAVKKARTKTHLHEELRAALAQSWEARRVACRAAHTRERGPEIIVVQPPPPQPVVIVLDEPRHRELVTVVRREAFDDGRVGVIELGVRDACLTSSQAKELVQQVTFSQARIKAVRALAPHIVDRERSHLILEALTFDSDRKVAREVLTATTTAPQCVVRRL